MKILITSTVDLHKSQHNRPHQFVRYLSKNHDVTVLTVNDWWKGEQADLESYSSHFNEFFKGVNFHYLTDRKISPVIQEVLFTKKIRELSKEDFDLHLSMAGLATGYRASKYFKTVFDLGDDVPEMIEISTQIPGFLKPIGKFLGSYYINKNIKAAKKVTLTTESLIDVFKIPADKVELVSNGVDTNAFRYEPNAKKELGLDGFIVGYVGVLREWIDLKPIFESLKHLNGNIRLLIVGSEGLFEENKLLAKQMGVSDRVIFTGMVPYSLVPKYISAMDVGIIPFKLNSVSHNALPLKLFEYFACEKPVISSKIGPIESNFSDCVLFASNFKDYIDNINLLYENEQLKTELGKKGRSISEEYSWEKITKELEKILIGVAYEDTSNITTRSIKIKPAETSSFIESSIKET